MAPIVLWPGIATVFGTTKEADMELEGYWERYLTHTQIQQNGALTNLGAHHSEGRIIDRPCDLSEQMPPHTCSQIGNMLNLARCGSLLETFSSTFRAGTPRRRLRSNAGIDS